MSKLLSYIVIIQFFSMVYCIGGRYRRVAVLNRKVSNLQKRSTLVNTSELNLFTWNDNIQSFGS